MKPARRRRRQKHLVADVQWVLASKYYNFIDRNVYSKLFGIRLTIDAKNVDSINKKTLQMRFYRKNILTAEHIIHKLTVQHATGNRPVDHVRHFNCTSEDIHLINRASSNVSTYFLRSYVLVPWLNFRSVSNTTTWHFGNTMCFKMCSVQWQSVTYWLSQWQYIIHWLSLWLTICYLLIVPVTICYLLIVTLTICYLLIIPVTICYLLVVTLTICYLLIVTVTNCFLLSLVVTICFYWLSQWHDVIYWLSFVLLHSCRKAKQKKNKIHSTCKLQQLYVLIDSRDEVTAIWCEHN